jgi:L-lactate dehydrogenase
MAEPKLKNSIAVIGCGDVGSTLAYALLLNPICNDVILVDPKTELLHAQVRDLNDATYRGTTATRVRAGTHKDAGQADIVIITAGAKQKPGRLLTLRCNIWISFTFLIQSHPLILLDIVPLFLYLSVHFINFTITISRPTN